MKPALGVGVVHASMCRLQRDHAQVLLCLL